MAYYDAQSFDSLENSYHGIYTTRRGNKPSTAYFYYISSVSYQLTELALINVTSWKSVSRREVQEVIFLLFHYLSLSPLLIHQMKSVVKTNFLAFNVASTTKDISPHHPDLSVPGPINAYRAILAKIHQISK